MHDRSFQQHLDGPAFPLVQCTVHPHDPFRERRLGDPPAGHVVQHLRRAPQRHHLGDQEVDRHRDHAIAVLQWPGQVFRKRPAGDRPAGRTALRLGPEPPFPGDNLDVDQYPLLMTERLHPAQVLAAVLAMRHLNGLFSHLGAGVRIRLLVHLRAFAAGTGPTLRTLVERNRRTRKGRIGRTLRRVTLEQQRHDQLHQRVHRLEQRRHLGRNLARRLELPELLAVLLELLADRLPALFRHHPPASTAMMAPPPGCDSRHTSWGGIMPASGRHSPAAVLEPRQALPMKHSGYRFNADTIGKEHSFVKQKMMSANAVESRGRVVTTLIKISF